MFDQGTKRWKREPCRGDTLDWPKTIEKIKREISGIKIIIPGHGKSGGT